MKIQSVLLAALLAPAFVHAQDKAAAPAQAPQATLEQKAEALSEEQIGQSHDIAGLSSLGQIYGAKGDYKRLALTLRRLTELLPNSGDLKLQLAMAYCKIGDPPSKTKAYDTLLHMQVQGFGYDIAKDQRFEAIQGTRVWDYLVANLAVNSKQFGEGKVAFELPKGDHLYQALAWDAKRKKLLVGSAREGKILLADDNGKLSDFIKPDATNGLWSIDALGVDQVHGKLYATSSASPLFNGFNADNAGKAGVFEFELATGKFLKKYILPSNEGAHILSRIAVGADGNVYAADGVRREVFKIEGGALKPLFGNPRLTGITGLALSGDGKTLYLSDYALGLFGYDLTKSSAFEVKYDPATLVLGGIDSLYWYEGNLIVVEGGMVPKRVLRLKLSDDGTGIAGGMPLDVAQPVFAELGQAALAGENLYFVANRQEELYDEHGVLTAADDLEPTTIFRSNLRFAWGQSSIGNKKGGGLMTIQPAQPAHAVQPPLSPLDPTRAAPQPPPGDTKNGNDDKH